MTSIVNDRSDHFESFSTQKTNHQEFVPSTRVSITHGFDQFLRSFTGSSKRKKQQRSRKNLRRCSPVTFLLLGLLLAFLLAGIGAMTTVLLMQSRSTTTSTITRSTTSVTTSTTTISTTTTTTGMYQVIELFGIISSIESSCYHSSSICYLREQYIGSSLQQSIHLLSVATLRRWCDEQSVWSLSSLQQRQRDLILYLDCKSNLHILTSFVSRTGRSQSGCL